MAEGQQAALPSTVDVTFSLRLGDGALQASVSVPAGRTNVTELLPILQNFDSGIVGNIAQRAAEAGRPISCKAGCGACCRQMVPISIFEAEAMSAWFDTLPSERQQQLEQRFQSGLQALQKAGILQQLIEQDWMSGPESVSRMAIDYFHAGVPCPFLEEESCSIHPIRPLICREYIVTSPPEFCNDPSVNDVSGVVLPLRPSIALFRLGQQLEGEGRSWFPLIFLLAWRKKGIKPGQYFSGTGQEVLRMLIDQLATLPPADETSATLSSGFMQPT